MCHVSVIISVECVIRYGKRQTREIIKDITVERTSKNRFSSSCKISIVTTAITLLLYEIKKKTREKKPHYFLHWMHTIIDLLFFFIRCVCVMFAMHLVTSKRKEKKRRKEKETERKREKEKSMGEYSYRVKKNEKFFTTDHEGSNLEAHVYMFAFLAHQGKLKNTIRYDIIHL